MSYRQFRSLLIALVCLIVAVPVLAQQKAPRFPEIKFEKYKLPNGLEVILSEDHRLPMVSVNLWYHVGAANEIAGRTGFAHLFEHMMFEGSKHVGPKAHFKYLESAGATDVNASTDFDRTNYFETVPANQLELALWLESDRMAYLLETVDREKLANQRDVVRNERRQSLENSPYGLVDEEVYHQLFPKGHPYYAYVIGSHEDIEAARLGDVRKFFQTYYSPSNASLAIVGDFNPAAVKQLVQKYFGTLPVGPPVPALKAATPPITKERRVTVTDQVELPRLYMAWLTPPAFQPGDADADIVSIVLGGGKSSRLYKKLVYELQIAQDVNVWNSSLALGSIFELQATAKPGVKLEDLEKAINAELEAFRAKGPTEAEVERARNKQQSSLIRQLERIGGGGGVADTLNRYNHYLGDPGKLQYDLQRYDKVTVQSAQKLAAGKLGNNERVVVYGVPGKKVIQDVAKTKPEEEGETPALAQTRQDEIWRSQTPRPAAMPKLTLPAPVSFKLTNGLTVMLVEQHKLPIISANLVTLSGSEQNPADRPGLASFASDMLVEGTKNRSALQIADDTDQIGAILNSTSTSDFSQVSIRTLERNQDAAFNLLSDVVLNPVFDAKEIERIRNQRLTDIVQEKDDPNTIARKASYMALYGPKHPYGYLESGTEASMKAITRDDLVNFWKSGYVPGNSALIVAGDIAQPELKKLAEKYFANWSGAAAKHLPPRVVSNVTRNIYVIDKPEAPQTALRFAMIGAQRSAPEYVPLQVMNLALGGLFSSRLNMNLREQHGYTYGAFSTFLYRRAPGPFIAVSGVRTDVTAPAVREMFGEIERMRRSELTPAELSMAKTAMEESLTERFQTTAQTAGTMSELFVYDLPLDYFGTLPKRIEGVNVPEIQRVANQYLRPEAMVVVAVGDRAKIEPELQKLKLAPVSVRDYGGNPVKEEAMPASAAK